MAHLDLKYTVHIKLGSLISTKLNMTTVVYNCMNTLAIYNHPVERLGILSRFLKNVTEIYAEEITGEERFDNVVIMGGPMGVYEREKYRFLDLEMKLIRRAYSEKKRVLGICLGSQLIAEALGGKVVKGQFGVEIGVSRIRLVNDFKDYFGSDELHVFQWHGDTFSLPHGATLLAYSEKYYQAFNIGRALGIQFHIEVDSEMLRDWLRVYGGDSKMIEEVREQENNFEKIADKLVRYWLSL